METAGKPDYLAHVRVNICFSYFSVCVLLSYLILNKLHLENSSWTQKVLRRNKLEDFVIFQGKILKVEHSQRIRNMVGEITVTDEQLEGEKC